VRHKVKGKVKGEGRGALPHTLPRVSPLDGDPLFKKKRGKKTKPSVLSLAF